MAAAHGTGRPAAVWRAVVISFALCRMASAHGDLDVQIAAMTARIQQQPAEAKLCLARAELHRLHRDWPAAAADYDEAERLAPALSLVHFGRGRMLLDAGRFGEAAMELDRFIEKNPDHADGLATRARAEMKSSEFAAAAADFARAIEHSPRPDPGLCVEHAEALAALGEEHVAEAVRVLDEGMKTLGDLPALGLRAIELEAGAGHFDAALARIDRLSAQSKRKESWHARRGEILLRAGRPAEARESFQAALGALESLPAHIRSTKAMAALRARMQQHVSVPPPAADAD